MASAEANKDIVRQYLEAFNEQEEERLKEFLSDEVVEHSIHEELHGPDEIIDFLRAHFETFPDYSGETEAMIAEDDLVTVRYTARGTHSDVYQEVEPTAHTVEWSGMVMYRIEDERIAEIWLEEDRLGLLEQLEAVDPPAHLRL